ncbi:MAG: hypothetical protein Kow0098_09850 [Ignavibacteriaceae bacterium]
MISKDQKRLLSEYIDRELSPEENIRISKMLDASGELRAELESMLRLKKLTSSAYEKLSESPYLSTRIIAATEGDKNISLRFRKWVPVIGISALTIILMVVLRFNPTVFKDLFEEQKSNLAGFYKENLQPLLLAANLTNEDIFNFAFYQELPLDKKENQYLALGYDDAGKEYFEIKKSEQIEGRGNLAEFYSALSLSEEQQAKVDSIIRSYADELEAQILINDKNTVAINPNLWNYQKALLADILAFAEQSNETALRKVIPVNISVPDVKTVSSVVARIKEKPVRRYIFLTPDSVFSDSFEFDRQHFTDEMRILSEEMKKLNEKNFKNNQEIREFTFRFDTSFTWNKHTDQSDEHMFSIVSDTNRVRVNLHRLEIPRIDLPDFDSISVIIENATKQMKNLQFTIPEPPKTRINNESFEFRFNDSMSGNADFQRMFTDSLLRKLDESKDFDFIPKGEIFNFFPDSSGLWIKPDFNDSLNSGIQLHLKEQLEQLREEMKKLREEMHQYFRFKNEKLNEPPDTVIEI